MFEISFLECHHTVSYRNIKDMAHVGDARWCRWCGEMRSVAEIIPWWRGKCKQCRWGKHMTGRFGLSSSANRHMLLSRHTVLCWKTDNGTSILDDTLFVVQPATSEQVRIELAVTENKHGQDLVDEPPF